MKLLMVHSLAFPARRSVASLILEVTKEVGHEGRIELLQLQLRGRPMKLAACVRQHQPERVRVRVACPRAGAALDGESIVEERCQVRGEEGHARAPSTTRLAASAMRLIDFGVASKYQYVCRIFPCHPGTERWRACVCRCGRGPQSGKLREHEL